MNITVIICTYNRCDRLALTLDSLQRMIMPETVLWEILVVDNNSNDRTREVAAGHRVRYLFEPNPGQTFAQNAGIKAAKGDILAFLDDDVTVHHIWLDYLTRTMRKDKTMAGAGGRTMPALGGYSLPRWLSIKEPYNSGGALAALFDLGDEPNRLEKPPYGANMAFRREMFEKYGLFCTDLGPSPNRDIPHPNNDTEFGRRLLNGGEKLWYEPGAIVYHPLLKERMSKRYLLDWWFDFGRADVREWELSHSKWLTIGKILVTITAPRILHWQLSRNPVKRFYLRCQVWKTLGWINELCRVTGKREKPRSLSV
jgi:glycosyltransferase involved in cell wall biosynthesis